MAQLKGLKMKRMTWSRIYGSAWGDGNFASIFSYMNLFRYESLDTAALGKAIHFTKEDLDD